MKEGIDKRISLGGIVRNTAGSISPDGQMDEIVNMRLKDGSFRPMSPNMPIDGIKDVSIDYTDIFIHTCDYRHWIGAKGGKLWYFANMDSSDKVTLVTPVELMDVSGTDLQYSQVGNLMTVIDEGLNYIYWKADKYVVIPVDYNGKQTDTVTNPDGKVDFRMAPETDTSGNRRLRMYHGDFMEKDPTKTKKIEATTALMIKALGVDKEKGNLDGFFFACTALRLYDGTFILQSRPVLVSQNADLGSRYSYSDYQRYTDETTPQIIMSSGTYAADYLTNKAHLYPNTIFHVTSENPSVGGEKVVDIENVCVDYSAIKKDKTVGTKPAATTTGFIQYTDSEDESARADVESPNLWGGLRYINKRYKPIAVTSLGKLQYKISNGINREILDEVVDSVCIFITSPVNMYKTEQWGDSSLLTLRDDLYSYANSQSVVFKAKTNTEIIKELMDSPNFYLIHEEKLEAVKPGSWIDIDLEKDGILKNLIQQETLNLDSNNRNSYKPRTSLSYNGRLHIANYDESIFHGWPLNYFFAQNTDGQFAAGKYDAPWDYMSDSEFNTFKSNGIVQSYVAVELDTSDGKRTVVRYLDVDSRLDTYNWQALNPFLSYPDNRATKMTICISGGISTGSHLSQYIRTFNLTAHKYWNVSYFMDGSIKPIGCSLYSYPATSPSYKPSESNSLAYVPNGLRVSATDNPLYFPAKNTYKVGNVEIIGMASNTIAVSTGQVGATPLYVFAKDGIYGLFVDASGEMTYTNSRPVSRDICNNAKSITPIDDGVVFSSDRGLMILSGSEVTRLSEAAEGLFLDLYTSSPDNFIDVVNKAISTTALVELSNSRTKEEFIDYIKGCIIGYNYKERELWVTNPTSKYSYVLSGGLWVKRDITCREYVNDYPNLYLLNGNQVLNVTKETGEGNETMFLTRPIKFDTQEFKQGYRTIIRGIFDLPTNRINVYDIDATEVILAPSERDIVLNEPLIEEIISEPNTALIEEVVIENTPLEPIVIREAERVKFSNSITEKWIFSKPYDIRYLEKKSIEAYTFDNVPNGVTRLLNYQVIQVDKGADALPEPISDNNYRVQSGINPLTSTYPYPSFNEGSRIFVTFEYTSEMFYYVNKIPLSQSFTIKDVYAALKNNDTSKIQLMTDYVCYFGSYLQTSPWRDRVMSFESGVSYKVRFNTVEYVSKTYNFEWVGTSQSVTLGAIYDACEAGFTNPDFEEIGGTNLPNNTVQLDEKHQYVEFIDKSVTPNVTRYFELDHDSYSISYNDLVAKSLTSTPFVAPLMIELQPNEQFVDWYYYGGRNVDGGRVVKYSGATAASFNYFDLRSYPKTTRGNMLPADFSFVYNLDTTTLENALDGSSYRECVGIISIKIDGVEKITSDFVYSRDARYLKSGRTFPIQPTTLAQIIEAKEVNNVINGKPVFDSYDESPLRFGYRKEGIDQTIVPDYLEVPSGYHSVKVLNLDGSAEFESNIWLDGGEVIDKYEFYDRLKVGFYVPFIPSDYDKHYVLLPDMTFVAEVPAINVYFTLQNNRLPNGSDIGYGVLFNEPNPITYNNLVANLVATDGNLSTHYSPATPFLPLLVTLEDETYYTIVHPDNHESNIYLEVGGDFDYETLRDNIDNGDYELFYTLLSIANLVQNNSYLFNDGTEYSFKYLGLTSNVLVKDIQTALESRANQGTVDYSNYGEVPLYYPESLTLTDGNGIHLTLPNLTEYRFVYKGESVISSSELISRLNNGIYLPIPKTTFPNDNLTLVDERNYKFTDLNANVYTFKYDGASTINYDVLVDLLVNDMFDHVTALADLTLNMTSGENVHLMVNYLTDPDYEKTFVYVGGGTIAALTLISNAKNGVYADVPANNLSQVIFIPANQVIHFTDLNGVEYYLRTDIAEHITYEEFLIKLDVAYYTILDPAIASPYLAGIYIFGSYDARRWNFLGGNEVGGTFRDLGALAERVDVKYFRILFVGNLKGNSSIEHIDMSVVSRLLSGKIR